MKLKMNYISNILLDKNIPIVCIVLAILIVVNSFIVFFNPTSSSFFQNEWWIVLMQNLINGAGDVPIYLHLTGNLIILILFGFSFEKTFGSAKTFLNIFVCSFLVSIYNYFEGGITLGSSIFTWSFGSFAMILLILDLKRNGLEVIKNISYIVYFLLFFVFMLIYQTIVIKQEIHSISLIIGLFFSIIWWDDIKDKISNVNNEEIINQKKDKENYFVYFLLLVLCVINIYAVSSVFDHIKEIQLHSNEIKNLLPSLTKEQLNLNDGKIVIKFKEEMKMHFSKRNISYSRITNIPQIRGMNIEKIRLKSLWIDSKTLLLATGRKLGDDEYLKIMLSGFKYRDGKISKQKIIIDYQ